jgi:phosphatidate cytidylyltransferase
MIGGVLFVMNFLFAVGVINQKYFYIFIPLVVLVFINELFLNNNRPFTNIAYTLLGIIYVAVPLSMINYLVLSPAGELFGLQTGEEHVDVVNYIFQPERKIIYSSYILLGFFFLVWAYDTGAYIIGIPFGKHKLFKRISPKKSWEGLFGGVFFAFVVSIIISKFFVDLRMLDWLVIALIVATIGTFGDLVESMFKRSVGVKDSGNILPGHGGLLDRFDGVFLSLPVVFAYIQFIT